MTNIAVMRQNNAIYLASVGTDGLLCFFERGIANDSTWVLRAKLPFKKMMETVSLFMLPHSNVPCIAVGGLDHAIHLFVCASDNKLNKVCSLQGHTDWIRAMSTCTADDGSVMIASASQDARVRLWKITTLTSSTEAPQEDVERELMNAEL